MKRTNDPKVFRAFVLFLLLRPTRAVSARDQLPVKRANDRVAHQPRLVRRKANDNAICAMLVRKSPQTLQKWLVQGMPRGCINRPVACR